jgi:hypothetical protein
VEADGTVASQVLAAQTVRALRNLEAGADQHAGDGVQPGWAQNPQASPQKVVNVEAVKQPWKRSSSPVTERGRLTGSIHGDLVVG